MLRFFWEHRIDMLLSSRPTIIFTRDPRDSIYSLYVRSYQTHFLYAEYLKRVDFWPHHLGKMFYLPPPETWALFYLICLRVLHDTPHLIIKYEDAKRYPEDTIRKVLRFLCVNRTNEEIKQSISASSIDNIKNALRTAVSSYNFKPIRAGIINEWHQSHSDEHLSYFNTKPVKDAMRLLGYEITYSHNNVNYKNSIISIQKYEAMDFMEFFQIPCPLEKHLFLLKLLHEYSNLRFDYSFQNLINFSL